MKLALVAIALAGVSGVANAGMFFDGDFLDTDWSIVNVVGPAGGQTGVHSMTGGNPAMFRNVTTNTNSVTHNAHVRSAWSYDPAGGAIQAIEWEIDFRNISSFGQGHAYALMILQGGVYYYGNPQLSGSATTTWQTFTSPTLTSGNFGRIDGQAGNPNFSSGVMTFGFYTANEGGNGINVGYDNLSINFVPEPATGVAVLVGAAFFLSRRRR
jgi:hypothetical protein